MGGTSVIARMFNHNLGWDLTRTNFVLDSAVVSSGFLIIGPLNTMYTIVALFVGKKATDIILEGLDPRKVVSVISTCAPAVVDDVIHHMITSATVSEGYG